MLLLPSSSKLHTPFWFCTPSYRTTQTHRNSNIVKCATKRTGKQRYPSEKKKLKSKHKELLLSTSNDDKSKFEGTWRLCNLAVPLDQDPGKDFLEVSDELLEVIAKLLKFPVMRIFASACFVFDVFFISVNLNLDLICFRLLRCCRESLSRLLESLLMLGRYVIFIGIGVCFGF